MLVKCGFLHHWFNFLILFGRAFLSFCSLTPCDKTEALRLSQTFTFSGRKLFKVTYSDLSENYSFYFNFLYCRESFFCKILLLNKYM